MLIHIHQSLQRSCTVGMFLAWMMSGAGADDVQIPMGDLGLVDATVATDYADGYKYVTTTASGIESGTDYSYCQTQRYIGVMSGPGAMEAMPDPEAPPAESTLSWNLVETTTNSSITSLAADGSQSTLVHYDDRLEDGSRITSERGDWAHKTSSNGMDGVSGSDTMDFTGTVIGPDVVELTQNIHTIFKWKRLHVGPPEMCQVGPVRPVLGFIDWDYDSIDGTSEKYSRSSFWTGPNVSFAASYSGKFPNGFSASAKIDGDTATGQLNTSQINAVNNDADLPSMLMSAEIMCLPFQMRSTQMATTDADYFWRIFFGGFA